MSRRTNPTKLFLSGCHNCWCFVVVVGVGVAVVFVDSFAVAGAAVELADVDVLCNGVVVEDVVDDVVVDDALFCSGFSKKN